jgi:YD repeat-containing protein
MNMNLPKAGSPLLYAYKYDQLNRLISMNAYNGFNPDDNSWKPINDYKENISYDANGNIKSYLRNGTGSSLNLNNYSYSYIAGTNKLQSITNSVNGQTKTYGYDAIGNTTIDGMQGVTNATWNVYGKLQSLTNKDGQNVTYTYSADGQRISKKVGSTEEWYVRDASGNVMVTYTKDASINSGHLSTSEFYKYGSSLLDIKNKVIDMQVSQPAGIIQTQVRGEDGYILADQSGNTRATVSDKKIQHSSDGTTVDYYTADVKNANLYSTYGAISKSFGGSPTLGFNGQRKSTEISASAQTAQFWEYNGDVGRRWNTEPLASKFPNVSPYATMDNNPILKGDPDGKDWIVSTTKNKDGSYTTHLKLIVAVQNASNSKIDMTKFATALSAQVKNSYSTTYNKKEYEAITMKSGLDNFSSKTVLRPKDVKVNVVVEVQVRVISSEKDLKSNEHLVQIQDASKLPGVYAQANDIGGTKVFVNASKVANMLNGNDNNTLVHELGHTFGLRHIDQKRETFWETMGFSSNPQYYDNAKQKANSNNAMFSGGSTYMKDKTSTRINGEQIEIGKQEYKKGDINNH